ncbi:MAG: glycosyltransferase family 4 protein [Acidobacteriota bacterium]
MRIGFDLRPAMKKNSRRRGMGKYTEQLARALLELDSGHHFVFYGLAGEAPHLSNDGGQRVNLTYVNRPSRINWMLDRFLLPRRLRSDAIEIFHATELTSIPLASFTRVWAHVHDLIPYIFKEETARRVPRDYLYALKSAWRRIERADLIITDSLHSRNDICEHIGVSAEKVKVIYPGSNPEVEPVNRHQARAELQRRYGIQGRFLFYVGGSDFRKNLKVLVSAFAEIRRSGYLGDLVMGGETFLWDIAEIREIREEIAKQGLDTCVIFPGYIPDTELGLFYSACDVFVFPSLYEGFGLPVLEAMKCGAPVLASRSSSIPEVGGEAAVYFDPADRRGLVDAFAGVHGNRAKLEKLKTRGFEQARKFEWRTAAQEIHGLYESRF